MRKSFTWLLSLFVTLGFMGIFFNGYADETQETVELYAGTTTACYNESNEYVVNVSVRDFIRLTKFDLNLTYPASTFDFVSATPLAAWTGGTVTVTESAGVINFNWIGSETTIGDNVKTDIFQLKFKLDGYPNLIANSFNGALSWSTKDFWYTIAAGPTYDAVNTVISSNGNLNVTQSYPVTNIEPSFVSETCAGGEATVKVTSPANVLYSFNGGAFSSNNEFAALPGNNVTIKVKNSDGCISHAKTVTVPQTINPVAFTVTSTNPVCPGGAASVFVSAAGGTGPYTYYYNTSASVTGAVTRTNFQFNVPTSSTTTTYYVAVQDANNCATLSNAGFWQTVSVVDTNTPVTISSAVVSNASCNGGTGTATVTLTPAIKYWVSLDGGSWVATASDGTKSFAGLYAGTHTVTAKTVSDCTISQSTSFTITQPDAMALDIVIHDTSCGGTNDGSIAVTVTGGTSSYTYQIQEGTGTITTQTSSANAVIFSNLKPTYYSLKVTDQNGCIVNYSNPNGTGNVIAVQKPTDINITAVAVTNALCNGGTGTITITATGGSGSYLYSVDGGTTSQTSNVFGSLVPGTYTITVQNKNGTGCPVTYSSLKTITQPAVLTAFVASTLSPTCADGSDGDITLNIGGGTKPYQYKINNGSWVTNVGTIAHIAVTVGTHTITVTDANSCASVTLTPTITQSTNSITATSSHVILCNGVKDGTVSATVVTWAGSRTGQVFKYAASAADVYTSVGQTLIPAGTASETKLVAGTYYVGAIDAYGCKATPVKVDVLQKPAVEITAVVATGASCFNTFDGVIAISAKGGNSSDTTTNPLQYAIVNEGVTSIPAESWINFPNYTSSTKVFSVSVQVGKGKYQVAVKDQSLCDIVILYPQTIEVTGYDQLKVDGTKIVVVNPLCNGLKTGSITVPASAVTGGSGTYKYTLLKDGNTITTTTTQQPTGVFGGLATGTTYQVKVEDSMGCPPATTANLTITEPAVLAFTISKTEITCNGANDGMITINVTGGTHSDTSAATQYKFAVNNQTIWVPFAGASKQYLAPQPGTYTIWVKDANECATVSQTVSISQPNTVSATVTVTNPTCNGSKGSIAITNPNGGWAGSVYTYKVDSGTATDSQTIGNISVGTHTLTVYAAMAADGTHQTATCSVAIPFTVTQPDPITYTVDINNVKCKGTNDGSMVVTVSGGTASSTGGYQVKVTGPAYDSGYIWTGSDKTHTFTGLTTGMYTVYIIDKNACTLSPTVGDKVSPYTTIESWEIQEPATALGVSANWISNAKCNGASNGSFTITATGGVAPYKFFTAKSILPSHIILPDADNASAWVAVEGSTYTKTDASKGTWIVWAQDANGCIVGGEDLNGVPVNAWRVQITEPTAITFAIASGDVTSPTCNGNSDGKIKVTNIQGGTASYTVTVIGTSKTNAVVNTSVTKNASTIEVTGLPASSGYYTIKVTDVNGCEAGATLTRTVNEPAALAISLTKGDESFTCPGAVEGWINATVTGGTAPYKYRLYRDGALYTTTWVTPSTFFVQIGHTWKVEVADKDGATGYCSANAEITINEPAPVKASLKDITCYSDAKASAKITATGEPGRTFKVEYWPITGVSGGVEVEGTHTTTVSFASEIVINNLTFANNNAADQGYYYFKVVDNKGCTSTSTIKYSFVPTQHPLQATLTKTDDLNGSVTITGGISPYTYQIGTAAAVTLPAAGDVFQVVSLKAGQTTITVTDAHGCLVAQSVTVSPVTVTAVPASGNNQVNAFDVKLTFNRDVTGVASATTVTSGTATSTFTVTGTGKVYTVSIKADDLATVVLTLGNTISDAASNTLTTTTFTYKIGDHVAPTVIVTPPATPVATVFNIGLKFSEPVSGVLAGTGVTVNGGKIEDITGMGSTYTVTVSAKEQTAVAITLTDVIVDLSANLNKFAGQTLSYTTGDFTKPQLVSWTPLDETTTDNHPTFTMTFDENVVLGTGSLKVYKVATTTPALIIPVTAAMVNGKVVTVTYAPTQQGLDKDARYYVLVDAGALKDNAGNTFDGVVDAAAWTFKTGNKFVTVTDPVNGSLKVYPNPFVDYVNVVTTSQLSKVVVTNIAGQIVKEVVNPTNTIQLSGLRSGVYFISMYDRDSVIGTAKIVKR